MNKSILQSKAHVQSLKHNQTLEAHQIQLWLHALLHIHIPNQFPCQLITPAFNTVRCSFQGLNKDKEKSDKRTESRVSNSFWVYNIVSNKWTCFYRNDHNSPQYWNKMQTTEPRPRYAHQLVYDEINRVILYYNKELSLIILLVFVSNFHHSLNISIIKSSWISRHITCSEAIQVASKVKKIGSGWETSGGCTCWDPTEERSWDSARYKWTALCSLQYLFEVACFPGLSLPLKI